MATQRKFSIDEIEAAMNAGIAEVNECAVKQERLKTSEVMAGNYILGRVAQRMFDTLRASPPPKRTKRKPTKSSAKSTGVAGAAKE